MGFCISARGIVVWMAGNGDFSLSFMIRMFGEADSYFKGEASTTANKKSVILYRKPGLVFGTDPAGLRSFPRAIPSLRKSPTWGYGEQLRLSPLPTECDSRLPLIRNPPPSIFERSPVPTARLQSVQDMSSKCSRPRLGRPCSFLLCSI